MLDALIGFAIAFLLFLFLRAVVLWYFKLDVIVALLTEINGRLALMKADREKAGK